MCMKGQPRLQHVPSWCFNQRRLWAQRMTGTKFQCFDIKDLNLNRKLFIAIYIIWKKGICWKVLVDPGRTWTCNLRCRKPTPYPLGHRAAVTKHQILVFVNPLRYQHSPLCSLGNRAAYEFSLILLISWKLVQNLVARLQGRSWSIQLYI